MHLRIARCALFLLPLIAGCGGGGGGPPVIPGIPQEVQDLVDCAALGTETLGLVFERLVEVFLGVDDPVPPAGITYQQIDPTTWNFTATLDIDGDQVAESGLNGSATFSSDPSGGLVPGDSVDLVFTFAGPSGAGNGQMTVLLNANGTVTVTGGGVTIPQGGCQFQFANVDLVVNPLAVGGYPTGTVDFNVVGAGGATLNGTLTFDGTVTASGNADYSGGGTFDFLINLDTGAVTFP
jgi:hypothetical protein